MGYLLVDRTMFIINLCIYGSYKLNISNECEVDYNMVDQIPMCDSISHNPIEMRENQLKYKDVYVCN